MPRSKHRTPSQPINYSVVHWMAFGGSLALNLVVILIFVLVAIFGGTPA